MMPTMCARRCVEMPIQSGPVQRETFAPILYVMRLSELDDAIRCTTRCRRACRRRIFTLDLREAEQFMSATGTDCGIANVNIGPSGAEIGGAFGGEKETGGGREAGSDAWKAYMRRRPTRSTTANSCRLRRACDLTFESGKTLST